MTYNLPVPTDSNSSFSFSAVCNSFFFCFPLTFYATWHWPKFLKSVILMLLINFLYATSSFTFNHILFRSFFPSSRFHIFNKQAYTSYNSLLLYIGNTFPICTFLLKPSVSKFLIEITQSHFCYHMTKLDVYFSSITTPAFPRMKLKIAFPSSSSYSPASWISLCLVLKIWHIFLIFLLHIWLNSFQLSFV